MNKRLTEGELIVLGLLTERPRHGYDLERIIRERGIREWTSLGFSSLYYILDKLAAAGLIAAAGPASIKTKHVFAPTPKGLEACRQAVAEALTTMQPYSPTFLIGLANSPILNDAAVVRALHTREAAVADRIEAVRATHERQQPTPDFVDLMFDYSVSLLQAERTWLHKAATRYGAMEKVDLKKELKQYYNPSAKEFTIVDVPTMQFLKVDGRGNPNTAQSYKDAVEALYSVSYALKFASKKAGKDYTVMPLEGLWTADDLGAFTARTKDTWKWTMMIMQPDWISSDMFASALETVRAKRNPAALDLLRLEPFSEGKAVQIMFYGAYDDEGPVLKEMHETFMPAHNLTFGGDHHEIYIGDPRKTEPSKLRTILRQPVKSI